MINVNDCFIRDNDTFIKIIDLYDNNLCEYKYISFINNEFYYNHGFSHLDYLKNKELKPISEEIWKQAESLYIKYIEDLKEYKDVLKYTFNSILNDSFCLFLLNYFLFHKKFLILKIVLLIIIFKIFKFKYLI